MTVARVVPLHESGAKRPRLVQVSEELRILRARLEGGEQALDERVVVAHVGPAARDLDLKLAQHLHQLLVLHRATVVRMDGQ